MLLYQRINPQKIIFGVYLKEDRDTVPLVCEKYDVSLSEDVGWSVYENGFVVYRTDLG